MTAAGTLAAADHGDQLDRPPHPGRLWRLVTFRAAPAAIPLCAYLTERVTPGLGLPVAAACVALTVGVSGALISRAGIAGPLRRFYLAAGAAGTVAWAAAFTVAYLTAIAVTLTATCAQSGAGCSKLPPPNSSNSWNAIVHRARRDTSACRGTGACRPPPVCDRTADSTWKQDRLYLCTMFLQAKSLGIHGWNFPRLRGWSLLTLIMSALAFPAAASATATSSLTEGADGNWSYIAGDAAGQTVQHNGVELRWVSEASEFSASEFDDDGAALTTTCLNDCVATGASASKTFTAELGDGSNELFVDLPMQIGTVSVTGGAGADTLHVGSYGAALTIKTDGGDDYILVSDPSTVDCGAGTDTLLWISPGATPRATGCEHVRSYTTTDPYAGFPHVAVTLANRTGSDSYSGDFTNAQAIQLQWTRFRGAGALTGWECRSRGASWQPCPPGQNLFTGLSEGRYWFRARARDSDGAILEGVFSFVVDRTPPLAPKPRDPRSDPDAREHDIREWFTSHESEDFARCVLDGEVVPDCDMEGGMGWGSHTLEVWNEDYAGNTSAHVTIAIDRGPCDHDECPPSPVSEPSPSPVSEPVGQGEPVAPSGGTTELRLFGSGHAGEDLACGRRRVSEARYTWSRGGYVLPRKRNGEWKLRTTTRDEGRGIRCVRERKGTEARSNVVVVTPERILKCNDLEGEDTKYCALVINERAALGFMHEVKSQIPSQVGGCTFEKLLDVGTDELAEALVGRATKGLPDDVGRGIVGFFNILDGKMPDWLGFVRPCDKLVGLARTFNALSRTASKCKTGKLCVTMSYRMETKRSVKFWKRRCLTRLSVRGFGETMKFYTDGRC